MKNETQEEYMKRLQVKFENQRIVRNRIMQQKAYEDDERRRIKERNDKIDLIIENEEKEM